MRNNDEERRKDERDKLGKWKRNRKEKEGMNERICEE